MSAKPRSYYDGGHRIVRDGIPCRVAAWVKDLSPRNERAIGTEPIRSKAYPKGYKMKEC